MLVVNTTHKLANIGRNGEFKKAEHKHKVKRNILAVALLKLTIVQIKQQ
jgi:hypothetical protein